MTAKEAAQRVLEEVGEPLHYETITERILESEYWTTNGATPEATVNAQLAVSIQQEGEGSVFQRVEPATYALRAWGLSEWSASTPLVDVENTGERRVRLPYFPTYASARSMMRILTGVEKRAYRDMDTTIRDQTGTPQDPVNWSDPDTWIGERLEGAHAELARRVWQESDHQINPRYTRGQWQLLSTYGLLLPGEDGYLQQTDVGKRFEQGDMTVTRALDEQEGLGKVLTILSTKGRAMRGDLLPEWGDYLDDVSRYNSMSTKKDTLRLRLRNLVDRGLVERDGNTYVIADAGLQYASMFAEEEGGSPRQELQRALKEHNDAQRVVLRDRLTEMSPNDFEYLVRDLLEEMGYEDVEVTKQSGDKGVDVVATVQLGITEVKEVVQVKRYTNTVNRPKIDQLRGALHYHDAIRGTLITLSGFSQGCKDSAVLPGAPPISLIDGERLLDLLIEHEIGIQRKPAVMYEVDGRYFDQSTN